MHDDIQIEPPGGPDNPQPRLDLAVARAVGFCRQSVEKTLDIFASDHVPC